MGTLLFLSMRVLHVALAGAWLGAAMFTALYLGPSLLELGPAGAPLLATMVRRGLVKYMASIGGLTVVTGLYLFWRFTGGVGPGPRASRARPGLLHCALSRSSPACISAGASPAGSIRPSARAAPAWPSASARLQA